MLKHEEILTFLAINDHKGIMKAADYLFVSQSTVSNRLASLEEKLQTKLIDRNPGQQVLSLTERGEEFLLYAQEWLYLSNTIKEWGERTPRKRLRIGSIDSISGPILKDFYRQITSEIDVLLEISTHWTDRIFDMLDNHHLDIGIVPRLFNTPSIITRPLFQEEMVVASFEPLAEQIEIDSLDPSNEIYFDWGVPFFTWHEKNLNPSISPKMIVDITSLLFQGLELRNSWAIVPLGVALDFKKHSTSRPLHIAKLHGSPPQRIAYIAVRPETADRKKELMDEFENRLSLFLRKHPYLEVELKPKK